MSFPPKTPYYAYNTQHAFLHFKRSGHIKFTIQDICINKTMYQAVQSINNRIKSIYQYLKRLHSRGGVQEKIGDEQKYHYFLIIEFSQYMQYYNQIVNI